MLQRLDQALVAAGLARSRSQAQALIAEGMVLVAGIPARKPASKVEPGAVSLTAQPAPWVSRAAPKLVHALAHFDLSPAGAVAVDIGASTGGFTQVLLSMGAAEVHAVDVGHGQLHPTLAADPKVVVHERINARNLPDDLLPPPDWIVCDVSFISAVKALPRVLDLAHRGATLVSLIKPQFEVGPDRVGKGGIVSDPEAWGMACNQVRDFVLARGWDVLGVTHSPITGSDGNREFLIAARKG